MESTLLNLMLQIVSSLSEALVQVVIIFAALFVIVLILALGIGAFSKKVRSYTSQTLKPLTAFAIGIYYVLWQVGVLTIAYFLIAKPPFPIAELSTRFPLAWLKPIQDSPIAFSLIQCFCLGGLGATVYGMLWLSKSEEEVSWRWMPRRYILLPPLGAFLGAVSYLFLKAGLITLGASSSENNSNANNVAADFAIFGVAFLAGFASRELTEKLVQIAQTIFTKVPDPPSRNREELTALVTQEEQAVKQNPTLANFRILARMYGMLGCEADVLATYYRALDQLPSESTSDRAQIYMALAQFYMEKEEDDLTLQNWQKAIELDSEAGNTPGFEELKKKFADQPPEVTPEKANG